MKLPEHYEKWIEEEFPESSFTSTGLVVEGMRLGAHRMYAKLMEDFAPAIEVCEKLLAKMDAVHKDPAYIAVYHLAAMRQGEYDGPDYSAEFTAAKESLAALKEKGLVE